MAVPLSAISFCSVSLHKKGETFVLERGDSGMEPEKKDLSIKALIFLD